MYLVIELDVLEYGGWDDLGAKHHKILLWNFKLMGPHNLYRVS